MWDSAVRNVRVQVGTQANSGGVAAAVVDFEPAEDYAFVVRLDYAPGRADQELVDLCATHFEQGVRDALTTGGDERVLVVLRWILTHHVDASAERNREAGRHAVELARSAR